MLVDASKLWAAETARGLESISFYWLSQSKDPGHDGCVSLCCLPAADEASSSSFVFLQWTKPGLEGRVADVTSDMYLKCIVPVGNKRVPLNLQQMGGHIILPWTSAKIVKDRQFANSSLRGRQHPNKLPEQVQRLVQMCRVAESRQQEDPRGADTFLVGSDTCFICSCGEQSQEHDLDRGAVTDDHMEPNDPGPLRACPVCLLSTLCVRGSSGNLCSHGITTRLAKYLLLSESRSWLAQETGRL